MQKNSPPSPATNFRWVICALLFFSTTVNYMDRQVISYLKDYIFCVPVAQGGFGWSNTDFPDLTSFFTGFYAGMTLFVGWFIDKVGTKLGSGALAHRLVHLWNIQRVCRRMLVMHMAVRSAFAIGEAGNFPASIKTVAEWFPKRERALATAIFNSGSNGGAMIAAIFVPWCMIYFGDQHGWKMAFILTGAAGFFWLIFWFWLYDPPNKQKRLSKAEYDYIHVDDEARLSTSNRRQGENFLVEAFSLPPDLGFFWGKFLTDGMWWFYLFWLPDYLHKQFRHDKARSHAADIHRLWRRHCWQHLWRQHSHDTYKQGHGGLPGAHDGDVHHRPVSIDRFEYPVFWRTLAISDHGLRPWRSRSFASVPPRIRHGRQIVHHCLRHVPEKIRWLV